ncbi:MAG: pseudaminic acid cytidylyltransferase [Oleispira sp.]
MPIKVAIIPARGGSKRIPRKNIKDFFGKPMIAWSIEAAKKSEIFDRIIVSTDDEEIAAIARKWGAEVPFMRPADLSDDHTATIPVIAHAVKWLISQGVEVGSVCCIYATAPFILEQDVEAGLKKLNSGKWSYCFSATEYSAPIFRSFKKLETGGVEMFYPDNFNSRSQDLPKALHDAGQFYWGHADSWLSNGVFFCESSSLIEIPRWRVQDIDTEDDWYRAELLAALLLAK